MDGSMKYFLSTLFACLAIHISYAQDQNLIDSLKLTLQNTSQDTTRANILYSISKAYWGGNPDQAMQYAKQTLDLSGKIGFKKGVGNAYISMGAIHDDKGDFSEALNYYMSALEIFEEIGYLKGMATSYNNIGLVYNVRGNFSEALKNYFASLKIKEKIGDRASMANTYNNIGIIYKNQGNYTEALKNTLLSLKIREEKGNKKAIADSYNSIGAILFSQGEYPEALKNFSAALKLKEETADQPGIAFCYSNIGDIYMAQGRYPEALAKYTAALKFIEAVGDKAGIAYLYTSIGKVYTHQHKYHEAEQSLQKGVLLSQEIRLVNNLKESYFGLTALDSAQGHFEEALDHYKLFIFYRDSLINTEHAKKTVQLQMQFDFDKKQVADSLQYAREKEVGALLLQRQKAITYTGFVGVLLTLLVLYMVFRNYQKQRLLNQQLREAQAQLIQSEKMAAFGVMASRVSHEILNPLNFVNNFSELSQDIVSDVLSSQSEKEKKESADLLIANLQKINEHGKRASGIIKQLQEHSIKGSAHEFFEQ
jgi:tetratricopeptide (TPR) repeat protein